MSRFEAACFHVANLLVALTGLVYGWMKYFAHSDDPYAIVNHPLQPWFQHAHVLVAPLLVFSGGAMIHGHATAKARHGERARKTSGWALLALLAPLVFSGYLLQTAADETWRNVWLWVHLVTSGLWLASSLAHFAAQRLRGAQANYDSRAASDTTTSADTRG